MCSLKAPWRAVGHRCREYWIATRDRDGGRHAPRTPTVMSVGFIILACVFGCEIGRPERVCGVGGGVESW